MRFSWFAHNQTTRRTVFCDFYRRLAFPNYFALSGLTKVTLVILGESFWMGAGRFGVAGQDLQDKIINFTYNGGQCPPCLLDDGELT